MRRILAAILAFACLATLTACSDHKIQEETTAVTTTTTSDPVYTTAATSGVLSERKETSTASQNSAMEITSQMAKIFEHGEVDVEDADVPAYSEQIHHTGEGWWGVTEEDFHAMAQRTHR